MESVIINLVGVSICGGILAIWGLDNFKSEVGNNRVEEIEVIEVDPNTVNKRPGKFEMFI